MSQYPYMISDTGKVSTALQGVYGMLAVIRSHPNGFDQEAMMELIQLWMLFAINIRGDGYWAYGRAMWLMNGYPETFANKPSVELANRLQGFLRVLDADDDTQHSAFTDAENAIRVMVLAYRHKLKLSDEAASKQFTETLLAYQHRRHFQ